MVSVAIPGENCCYSQSYTKRLTNTLWVGEIRYLKLLHPCGPAVQLVTFFFLTQKSPEVVSSVQKKITLKLPTSAKFILLSTPCKIRFRSVSSACFEQGEKINTSLLFCSLQQVYEVVFYGMLVVSCELINSQ